MKNNVISLNNNDISSRRFLRAKDIHLINKIEHK